MRFKARTLEGFYALLLLFPFVFTLAVFFLYAFLRTLFFSFSDYDLFKPPQWVGLRNYLRLFQDPLFLTALKHTLAYSGIVTSLQTALALLLALSLNRPLRGVTFFRTVYYLPSVVSTAAASLLLLWLFQRTGVVNQGLSLMLSYLPHLLIGAGLFALLQGLQAFWRRRQGFPTPFWDPGLALASLALALLGMYALGHLGWPPAREVQVDIPWFTSRATLLGLPYPLWAIILMNTYTTIPTFMVIFLAGLKGIPRSLYEAAALDGASSWTMFWRITLPLLRPVLFLVITLGLIGTLQLFDQVLFVGGAGGAPLESTITLAYYVYGNVFPAGASPRVGLASAAALVLAVLTLAIVLLQRRFGVGERGWS
ncbi:sugar ABC transporter permease [Thermus scotoductus]|uniref:Sugar ABC transporter permease n=2 Tax=Thermus TaxID=270 RepID=A0A430UYT6_THESC|nr:MULTISPECIES: sugar ABC transporter permease [Thermus]QWK21539.1 MAG: sugar ABC transporter permease [Thermus antranikianii]RTH98286.1 sugar ABC transporter permease [Thermus scotoductus]RTI14689.1 sugar ABC transporter permease [Thermus scotoductus]WCM39703.1 ABC transporter permease subunit [Thermus antranikianii]